MNVAELFAKLGFDVDKASHERAEKAIESLEKGFDRLKEVAAMAGIGIGLEKFGEMVKGVGEQAHEIENTAVKTGLTTDAVQELGFAADMTGTNMESLTRGTANLGKMLIEAKQGSKEAVKAFAAIGVNPANLKDTNEALDTMADAFSKLPDGMEKAARAKQLFGKAGVELLPFLSRGAKGVRALREEFQELGGPLGKDALEAGEKYTETLKRMHFALTRLKQIIATAVMPILEGISSAVTRVTTAFTSGEFALTSFGKTAVTVALAFAAAWAVAASPLLAVVAILAAAFLIAEDVISGLRGGNSAIFELIEAWGKWLDVWLEPKETDPWWLKLIKGFLITIKQLPETVVTIFNWFKQAFQDIVDWVKGAVQDVKDTLDELNPFSGKKKTTLTNHVFGAEQLQHLGIGPAATLSAEDIVRIRGQASSTANAQTTIHNLNVYAQTGDVHELAAATAKAIDAHQEKTLRAAAAGVQ